VAAGVADYLWTVQDLDQRSNGAKNMANNPLDGLCEAVRTLPVMMATNAINDLLRAGVINFNDAVEYQRALGALRELVRKRDAAQRPSN
jgi:hypothetical protein